MATEKRLIDANALKKKADMRGHCIRPMVTGYHLCVSVRDIDNAPTVDAVEVVHGRWKKSYDAFHDLVNTVCSCCGHTGAKHFNYCPNCGAKMDGDGNG